MRRSAARMLTVVLLLAASLVSPFTGATAQAGPAEAAAEVRGFVDAHSHLFSYEAFGGKLMCGRPFHPDGIAQALKDCADHYPNGELAWFENFTRTGSPTGTHDPAGWPTFAGWPPTTR